MTTSDLASGRLATSRARRGSTCLFLALLAGLASAPALAGPGLAADSADQRLASTVSQELVEPQKVSERSVLFASDVNLLIASGATAQAAAEPEGRVQSVLKRALALLGTPYRWGGNSPDGFDCSGLVGYVFRSALGVELPRVSRDMANDGEKVERAALTAGDLVFFSRRGKRVDHVGIYVGNGQFVHAPRTGKDVMVSNLSEGYWSQRYLEARRVAGLGT